MIRSNYNGMHLNRAAPLVSSVRRIDFLSSLLREICKLALSYHYLTFVCQLNFKKVNSFAYEHL